MKEIYDSINQILTDWNPIGVSSNIAKEEYSGYIPLIIKHTSIKGELFCCLENILINELQCGYSPNMQENVNDLQIICDKIMLVFAN